MAHCHGRRLFDGGPDAVRDLQRVQQLGREEPGGHTLLAVGLRSPLTATLERIIVPDPRSSNGRTAAFGAVNRGSNPCRGAKLPSRVPTRSSRFLFYDFPGSNAARFGTVRIASSATHRLAKS